MWSRYSLGSARLTGRPHQSSTTAAIRSKSPGVAVRNVSGEVTA